MKINDLHFFLISIDLLLKSIGKLPKKLPIFNYVGNLDGTYDENHYKQIICVLNQYNTMSY